MPCVLCPPRLPEELIEELLDRLTQKASPLRDEPRRIELFIVVNLRHVPGAERGLEALAGGCIELE